MKNILRLVFVLFCILWTANSFCSTNIDKIVIDFNDGWLRYKGKQYPVVLPRSQFRLPVTGVITRVDRQPIWYPTPNTRASTPGLPKVVPYGHKLNAMGEGRIVIDFDQYWMKNTSLKYVRIHGNADYHDLHKRKSRGCIRLLDQHIITLMKQIGENKPLILFR